MGTDLAHLFSPTDLDIESIQFVGDSVWIGDEFGPYLVEFSRGGTARGLYEVPLPGQPAGASPQALVRSPDNEALSLPNPDGSLPPYNLKRSKVGGCACGQTAAFVRDAAPTGQVTASQRKCYMRACVHVSSAL